MANKYFNSTSLTYCIKSVAVEQNLVGKVTAFCETNSKTISHIYVNDFIQEYSDYLKNNDIKSFQQKYENVDVLIIDQMQTVLGKMQTEEMVSLILNKRIDTDKETIIVSDITQAHMLKHGTSVFKSIVRRAEPYMRYKVEKPYTGEDPYIFISYRHEESEVALSVVSKLQENGFRVWYDEGIDPGTEWDESIAKHIKNAYYLFAFMSKKYLLSDNCIEELNYARNKGVSRLVIYLEDVELPDGIEMRTTKTQSIFKFKYNTLDAFFEKLLDTENINVCKDNVLVGNEDNSSHVDESVLETNNTIDEAIISKEISDQKIVEESVEENEIVLSTKDETENSYKKNYIIENSINAKELNNSIDACVFKIKLVKCQLSTDNKASNNKPIIPYNNPINLKINNTNYDFDNLYEIAKDGSQFVVAIQQEKQDNETLLLKAFVFRHQGNQYEFLSFGAKAKKIYSIFKNAFFDKYEFVDKRNTEQKTPTKKHNHKHFAKDTAKLIYGEKVLPPILKIPEKYEIISHNAFGDFGDNAVVSCIKLSSNIIEIQDFAFRNIIVKDVIFAPPSIHKIGKNVFNLSNNAFIFCEESSRIHKYAIENNIKYVLNKRVKSDANTIDKVLIDLKNSHKNGYTRISYRSFSGCGSTTLETLTIPENIVLIENGGISKFKITKSIIIPNSVKHIDDNALNLDKNAYVICDKSSYAYQYCKENKIANSVDLSDLWKSQNYCSFCGGELRGVFKKRCSVCNRIKNY